MRCPPWKVICMLYTKYVMLHSSQYRYSGTAAVPSTSIVPPRRFDGLLMYSKQQQLQLLTANSNTNSSTHIPGIILCVLPLLYEVLPAVAVSTYYTRRATSRYEYPIYISCHCEHRRQCQCSRVTIVWYTSASIPAATIRLRGVS